MRLGDPDRNAVIVGITGGTGLVGGAIARAFATAGANTVVFGRRSSHRYDLTEPVDDSTLAGIDVLIHAAYAPGADNVGALERLRRSARAAGVGRFVFVSSFAATGDASSAYGREKWRAESALSADDLIVRPGLVAGNGGLYRSMRRAIVRLGLAPVFGDGRQPVYLVEAMELARAVTELVAKRACGVFACAAPEPIAFRDLCVAIGAAAGKRVRCVPLPTGLALAVTLAIERVGLRGPVSSESVRGIANLHRHDVPAYDELDFAFAAPREAVRLAERAFA